MKTYKFWSTSSPPERLAGRRDDVNLNKFVCHGESASGTTCGRQH